MLKVVRTTKFLKDLKKARKRGLDLKLLDEVIFKLANRQKLDDIYKDHQLFGEYENRRE